MISDESLSQSEEDYLQEIYLLSGESREIVLTNELANKLSTLAPYVTNMLDVLLTKKLISYKKYQGCRLSKKGETIAIQIIRRHRLWKTFLFAKLNYDWSEISNVAIPLKYTKPPELIDRLEQSLGSPKFDPHGYPIPDKNGKIIHIKTKKILANVTVNSVVEVVSVNDDSLSLLKYLDSINISIGSVIKVCNRYPFDESLKIEISGKKLGISKKVAECISVKPTEKK